MLGATLDHLLQATKSKIPTALVTDVNSGKQAIYQTNGITGDLSVPAEILPDIRKALAQDKSINVQYEDFRYFIHVYNPPKRMIIIGAVHISQALAPMAKIAGFDVVIVDPRSAWATPERFPNFKIDTNWPDEAIVNLAIDSRTALVALTHDPKLDDPALKYTIKSQAFYVGALGSKKTHTKRIERLENSGFSMVEINKIKAPIGIDIGALSPAEIAISIMGEVILSLNGAKSLNKTKG